MSLVCVRSQDSLNRGIQWETNISKRKKKCSKFGDLLFQDKLYYEMTILIKALFDMIFYPPLQKKRERKRKRDRKEEKEKERLREKGKERVKQERKREMMC